MCVVFGVDVDEGRTFADIEPKLVLRFAGVTDLKLPGGKGSWRVGEVFGDCEDAAAQLLEVTRGVVGRPPTLVDGDKAFTGRFV